MRHITILFALLLAAPAVLGCEYPDQRVDIPNGGTATGEEMLTAQQNVKSYIAAMEAYVACLEQAEADIDTEDEEIAQRERYIILQRHNAAVEAMQIVADRFNVQVRAYKDAGKADKS